MSGRAFITGVSSFAGSELARQLVTAGWSVAGTVKSRCCEMADVNVHALDIADVDALADAIKQHEPSIVFHLAAIVDTVTTPSTVELHRVNSLGTAAVVEAVGRAAPESRLVYTSSAFVYGRTAPEEQPIVEELPLRALTPYGASKVAGEAIVQQYARAGGDAVITRAFQHTGRGHVGAYALSDWAEQIARIEAGSGSGKIVVGNLDVERDYLDVRDVASAYAALAERGTAGEIYNVSSGVPVTMRALLEGLIGAFGVDATIDPDPARMRSIDQPRFVGDPAKLKRDIGWEPHHSLSETLAELAQFWRERIAR